MKNTYKVEILPEEGGELPWEWSDGYGIVSDWTTRDKRPGELILCADRNSKRFYDFAGTMKKARAEGWDHTPYNTGTKDERARRAVMADYENLKAWCDGDWSYVYVMVTCTETGDTSSLGMIASNSSPDYFEEVQADLIAEIESVIDSRQTEEATL